MTNRKSAFFVIFLFLLCVFALFIMRKSGGELEVNIYQDGNLVYTKMLKNVEKSEEITVAGCTILVEKDGARVIFADCPDGVCVNAGKLTKAGQAAICLPNRVSVEISGAKSEVDAYVG